MYHDFIPVKYWSTAELLKVKARNRSEMYLQKRNLAKICPDCPFLSVCSSPSPCSVYPAIPFIPLHILKYLVKIGMEPVTASLKSPSHKFRIRFYNSQAVNIPLSYFHNGREAGDNIGFLLSRNPFYAHRFHRQGKTSYLRYPTVINLFNFVDYLFNTAINPSYDSQRSGNYTLGTPRKVQNESEFTANYPPNTSELSGINPSETLRTNRNTRNVSESYWSETIQELFTE